MGLSIAHTMNNSQFENKENLRNAAKNILNRQGASQKVAENMLQTVFGPVNNVPLNSGAYNTALANQFAVDKNLKETLKYLKNQSSKKNLKTPVFGEIWETFNEDSEKSEYVGELLDFEIDNSVKNIFIAA
ncbi:hypothetical protein IJD34_06125 [bacterium]|nr:hypothetical protein [bacterium]